MIDPLSTWGLPAAPGTGRPAPAAAPGPTPTTPAQLEQRIQTLDDFEMVISAVLDGKGKEVTADGTPCELRTDSASSGQQWTLEYVYFSFCLTFNMI